MRFVKNNKFKITCALLVVLLWIYIIVLINPFHMDENTIFRKELAKGEVLNVIDPINSETVVEQTFTAKYDNLSSLSLCFDNMGEQKYGKVLFKLLSSSGTVLAQEDIDMSTLEDKKYYAVVFDKVEESKNKQYKAQLTSTVNDKTGAVSVWYCSNDGTNVNAMVNGNDIGGVLKMQLGYYDLSILVLRVIVWLLVIILSIVVVFNISASYEKNFLLIAGLLGFVLVFINPFPHAFDESTHFFRTFMISQGDFHDIWYHGLIGGNVSDNFNDFVFNEDLTIKNVYKNPEKWLTSFSNEREFMSMPYMSSVIPVNHSFAAIPVFLCRLFGLPAVFVILSGRIFTYLIYTMFCYYAIKKVKYYKSLFFILATLPTCLWLAGSFSTDPFIISASLLFSSICLRHLFDKKLKITVKEKAALIITSIMILSVKYLIYLPVLLLIFMIPKDKFKKRERVLLYVIGTALVAVFLFWQIYLLKKFPFQEDRNGDVNVSRQISYVMGNLFAAARTFMRNFGDNIINYITAVSVFSSLHSLEMFIGVVPLLGAVLETDKYVFENKKEKRKLLIICFAVLVICIPLIMASLYAGFTPVGSDVIDGIQPRYFYPIILFAMLPLSMINITNNMSQYKEKLSIVMEIGLINMLGATLKRSI